MLNISWNIRKNHLDDMDDVSCTSSQTIEDTETGKWTLRRLPSYGKMSMSSFSPRQLHRKHQFQPFQRALLICWANSLFFICLCPRVGWGLGILLFIDNPADAHILAYYAPQNCLGSIQRIPEHGFCWETGISGYGRTRRSHFLMCHKTQTKSRPVPWQADPNLPKAGRSKL